MHKPVPLTRGKLLVIVVSIFLVLIASVTFSLYSAERAVRASERTQQQQALLAVTPVCHWLYATSAVYKETPPSTPTGKKQAESIENLIMTFECEELVPRG